MDAVARVAPVRGAASRRPLPAGARAAHRVRGCLAGLADPALDHPLAAGAGVSSSSCRAAARVTRAGLLGGGLPLLGVERRVLGRPRASGRPVLFASNHSSWLDVPALGGTLEACFIAKAEVGTGRCVRTVARLGRTVFVSRRAARPAASGTRCASGLLAGDNLILFPEGTSSDGSRVLPFRSAFFSVAEASRRRRAAADPAGLDRLRPAGRPADGPARAGRSRLVWRHGSRQPFLAARALPPPAGDRAAARPIEPAAFPSRKALAQAVWHRWSEAACGAPAKPAG